jgi:hypothetical protein
MGKVRNTKFWSENQKGRDHFRRKWENNVRIDLRDIGWASVAWIHLAQ